MLMPDDSVKRGLFAVLIIKSQSALLYDWRDDRLKCVCADHTASRNPKSEKIAKPASQQPVGRESGTGSSNTLRGNGLAGSKLVVEDREDDDEERW